MNSYYHQFNISSQNKKFISTGFQGNVFKITKEGKDQALKEYHGSASEQIHNEINILQRLQQVNSPNSIQVHYTDYNNAVAITEFCDRGDLAALIEGQPLSENSLRVLMAKIFKSQKVLQDMRIAHNDIKPENICMNSTGQVKLIDFGFSKDITLDCNDRRCTPCQAAPEQHQGVGQDNSSVDMWALGEVMFMLAFREHSCSEEERRDGLHSQVAGRVKLLNLKRRQFKSQGKLGERLLSAMLQFDPADRITFTQMFDAQSGLSHDLIDFQRYFFINEEIPVCMTEKFLKEINKIYSSTETS